MQPSELFSTIAQIQQDVETLIKRGKPISPEELQQLINVVKAQSQPQLNSAQLAEQLGPYLQARVAVPEAVHQAGVHASVAIANAVQYAIAQAEFKILHVAQQGEAKILRGITELQQVAQTIPRRVEVRGEVIGFTSKRSAYLLLGFTALLLLTTVWAVVSRGAMQAELAKAEASKKEMTDWVRFYLKHRKELIKNHPAIGYYYFPHPNDPKREAGSPKKGRK